MAPDNTTPPPVPAGQRLRALRKRRRLSLQRVRDRLAERGVETSVGYIAEIERGESQPANLEMVLAIEDIFKIPAESWPRFTALARFLELRRAS